MAPGPCVTTRRRGSFPGATHLPSTSSRRCGRSWDCNDRRAGVIPRGPSRPAPTWGRCLRPVVGTCNDRGPGSFRGWPNRPTPAWGGACGRSWGLQRPGGGWHSNLRDHPAGRAADRGCRAVVLRSSGDVTTPGPPRFRPTGAPRHTPQPPLTGQTTHTPSGRRRQNGPHPGDPLGFMKTGGSGTPGHPDFLKPESITKRPGRADRAKQAHAANQAHIARRTEVCGHAWDSHLESS
ncbi:hypothetical protein EV382_1719 [Micromonospora violae]|uniref:Uncharacterized protein n=1 Tax=Micromonospora violae TaxID=1278207 RepID=A0A4Q7UGF4_9ACTN|nr:hypothetical protein EV382_1719 [Micromonospora violae]